MRETLPESSHGLGEPEQDVRVVSHRAPKVALNDMVLTSVYAEGLGNALMEVWGRRGRWRRGGKVQGRDAPRVDCGSGYKHQRGAFNISVTHIHERDAPGVVTWSGRP